MSQDTVVKFQSGQRDVVSMLGAFVTCLRAYISAMDSTGFESNEVAEVRKLQPIVGEFMQEYGLIRKFLNEYNYVAYATHIGSSVSTISTLLANQTMPSIHVELSVFKNRFEACMNIISEAMIVIAQIPSKPIDANLCAGNSFTAYCFLNSIISTSKSQLIIVDPYIDKTIFFRYLSGLNNALSITIATDSRKLKGIKLEEFKSVEDIFKTEYPNYKRDMYGNLHDRYLINEIAAYSLGGSIVHAAYRSDFSVVQLSDEKKLEIEEKYA